MGAKRAERQMVVQGTPQRCFDALWLPGRIAPILDDQVMQRSVEDLKARVETAA